MRHRVPGRHARADTGRVAIRVYRGQQPPRGGGGKERSVPRWGSIGPATRVIDLWPRRGHHGDSGRGGRDVAFEDVEVYASNSIAVLMNNIVGARLERMRAASPGHRPPDQLQRRWAQSLDGGRGGVVRDSEVRRTLDDGIAVNSVPVRRAGCAWPNRLGVKRSVTRQFENGLNVSFVDHDGGRAHRRPHRVADAGVRAPVVGGYCPCSSEFDRGLPPLGRDAGMVPADAQRSAAQCVVENNLVEDVLFAQGIYLAGVAGVTVRGNTVRRASSGGMLAWQAMQIQGVRRAACPRHPDSREHD